MDHVSRCGHSVQTQLRNLHPAAVLVQLEAVLESHPLNKKTHIFVNQHEFSYELFFNVLTTHLADKMGVETYHL